MGHRCINPAPTECERLVDALARDVLTIAGLGGMPDSYWLTDRRIGRACKALGISREKARARYGK